MSRGYQPDFDRDVEYGERMELVVEGVLSMVRNGGYLQETKADRYANGHMFLEWEHDPHRRGVWKPSALQTTKADVFIYAHGDYCFEMWRTEVLRRFVSAHQHRLIVGGAAGDNPTRGVKTNKFEVLHWARRAGLEVAS